MFLVFVQLLARKPNTQLLGDKAEPILHCDWRRKKIQLARVSQKRKKENAYSRRATRGEDKHPTQHNDQVLQNLRKAVIE